jgi:hypothetical protein
VACAVARCAACARRWVEERGRAARRADANADADADADPDIDPADRSATDADAATTNPAGLRTRHLAAVAGRAGAGDLA